MRIRFAVRLLAFGAACVFVQLTLTSAALGDHNGPGPPNDHVEDAQSVSAGPIYQGNNTGAHLTVDDFDNLLEDDFCEDPSAPDASIAATAWYRFVAPAPGTIAFTAEGGFVRVGNQDIQTDTVVQAYRSPDTLNPLTCSDDGATGLGSRVSFRADQGQAYLAQVGGYFDTPVPNATDEGPFAFSVSFVEDCDLDDDSVNGRCGGADCNDNAASIRPGLPELVNNEVDENCDGVREFDRDRDGARAPSADCNDSNPAVRPGVRDVPMNGIDDNCDGQPPTLPMVEGDAALNFTFKDRTRNRFIKLTSLDVEAGRGARIVVTCKRGRKRLCRRQARTASSPNVRAALRFKRVSGIRARPGTTIEVRITKKEHVGRYFSWRTRKGTRGPRTTRCINPSNGKLHRLRSCPSAFL